MKTWFKYIHIFIVCVGFTTITFAQPANDACAAAIPITVGVGSCNSTLYTNVAATTASDPATPACWSPNSLSHTVWFSFVATTADIEISTNFGGTLANTQLAVYSGACGSLTQIGCQEDINTGGSLFHTDVILHGLTIGNTYYLLVDGNGNTTGTFGICAQQALPIGPALPVQDCATAQTLCSVASVTVPNGIGGVGITPENPSCFGAPGERSSNWYTFTVATTGTLAFTITPTAVIDYDFAVFNTTSSCPGTEIKCNWSPTTGASGTTGLGCAGAQCETTFTVTAGQTYTILVDRFTATSSAGFTLNFAGTTATFASPNPTFTNTTVCVGTATQFTNTTNGNFTYNWNFGDGTTSNIENPSHTYAAAGSYTATLLLTAVPGGCQNAISRTVTVNPIPTVNAGTGGTICAGNCITLGGSTNAVGFVGPTSFTNGGTYAIPDGSLTGVYSPITTSGLLPTTIAGSSIASVCINMTHTWDSDLDIYLQCPDGTRVELSTDNGAAGVNYTNTCFTPTAVSSITTGTPPFTGTYLPEQSFNVLNGCAANGTWQLFVQDDLGGDAGSISGWTITFNNNQPAFTWSPTTAMTNSTTLSPTVCPTTTTTYTLTASNGIGCTATSTVTVNLTPATITPTFNAISPICSGTALAPLPTTSTNGITGTWSPALNNTATTTYTFTPAPGQCATTTTLTITVKPLPSVTSASPSYSICSGPTLGTASSATINLTPNPVGASISWSGSDGNSGTGTLISYAIANNTCSDLLINYTIIPTNNGCSGTALIVPLTVRPKPIATFTVTPNPVCQNQNATVTFTGTSCPGATYNWTWPAGVTIVTGSGAGPYTISFASATTYNISLQVVGPASLGSCTSPLVTVPVTITPLNTIAPGTNQTVCISTAITNITLATTGATGATFSGLPAGVTGSWAANTVTISGTPTAAGTFNYTVTTTGGCPPATTTGTITVTPLNTIAPGTSQTVCINSAITNITLATTGATGATFSGLPAGVTGSWAGNVATISGTPTASGTFNYTVTTTGGCPPAIATGTITVTPINTIAPGTNQTVCINSAITNITLATTGATGATFSGLPSGVTGSWAGNVATISGTPTAGGTFNYTVTTTGGCPPATTTGTITVTPLNTIAPGTNQTVCINSAITNITLATTGATGATFSGLPAGLTGSWAANTVTINGTPTAGGTFNYTVTTTGGCPPATTTGTITVTPLNTIAPGTNQTVCINSAITNITLATTGATGATFSGLPAGVTGSWAANTVTIFGTPTAAGTFNYTVTTTGGCPPATTTGTITVVALPVISLTPTDPTVCNGTNGSISVSGSGTGTIFWSGTASGSQAVAAFPSVISGLASGNYNVYFVNSTNCQSATVSVTLNNPGAPIINSISNVTNCGTSYTLPVITGTNLVAPQYYTLPGGPSGGGSVVAVGTVYSAPTNITLYAYDQNGVCNSQQSFTIVINPLPTVTSVTGGATYCTGNPVSPINVAVTGTPNFSVAYTLNGTAQAPISGAASPVSLGNAPGIYVVTNITDANCTNTASGTQTITITPLNTIAPGTNQTVCINSAITNITLATTGATGATFSGLPAGVTGNWAANAVTISGTPTAGGTFNYTVTTTGGCPPATTTGTITVTPLNTIAPGTNQTVCINSAVTNITLATTGATGATFSGLPAGLSGSWAANTVTINGTPTAGGTFNYTVTTTGGCPPATTTGTITVTPLNTIAPGTNQTVCINSAITNITLATTGATGATFSGLPAGVIGNWASNTVTISGTPTAGGTFNYTVTTIGGCPPATTTGTITVTSIPTATISYAGTPFCSSVTTAQGVTLNGTGAYTGGVYSSTAGLTINPSTGVITPSSSTPNTYTVTYTIAASGGCAAVVASTTVTINPSVTPTFTALAAICSGETLSPLPIISNNNITGTWSPALNNTTTTTYTFTPTTGQCATTNTLIITVYSVPQINSINPLYYCDPNNDGFGVFDMTQVIPTVTGGNPYPVSFHETLTDAEINGTTIPNPSNYFNIHIDQQTIYIRVESTESSSCYKILTLELIVNPTPVATEPDDYHVCDTNYDGFASFDLTTVASQIFGSINQSTHSIGYYTSLANAQLATNPISNLTNFINQTINTQTIWIRVTNSATGCYDIVTLQLFVDPLPLATQPNYPPYTLCDNNAPLAYEEFDLDSKITAILIGQTGMNVTYHFNQFDALADINPLPLLYTNASPYVQTLWIRVENAITGCFVLSTIDIRVEPLPSPIPQSEPYTICDGNQDGFGTFDLNTLTADILQGANYTITYHETIEDAQLGNNPLISPYDNITPFVQIIYASAIDNVNGCRSVIPIELNVNPQPITPFTVPNLIQCDEDSNPQNLSMVFDLTQNDASVLAIQPLPASNYTVTYYISQNDANDGTAPIIQSTYYIGDNHEIIWVRVENNNSNCYSIGSFELLIIPPLALTTPAPLSICDDDTNPNNQYTQFDLTVKNNEITGGLPNMTVTYYPSYPVTSSSVAIPNPTTYINISPAVQTLGVMVTNAQGCRSYISLDIRVLPIPTPRTTGINPLPAQCDINNTGDMLETFNLTLNASIIINGDSTLTLHYYPTQADALANTNQILNPTAALVGHNVWIRVENNRVDYLGNHCFVLVEQPLTVNPLPTIIQPLTVQNCDDNADGRAPFNLTSTTASLLGTTQLPADFTITYYTTATNAQAGTNAIPNPTNFNNTVNPQIIYIRVVNNTTGCFNTGQFTLVVNPKPTVTTPAAFETCDVDGTNDGYFTLDLSTYSNGIIGAQTDVNTTFYNTQTDAINGTNAISNLTNYQAYTHTVWIRVEDDVTGCYQLTTLPIIVEPLPEPIISSPTNNICVDYATNVLVSGLTLNSGLSSSGYTFAWSLDGIVIPGAISSTYTINTVAPGDYTVVATSTSSLACVSNISNTFPVIQSGPAQFSEPPFTISNDFSDNQIITVNVVGFGSYEFSLDEGPFQSSNIFNHASLGEHTITVRDVKGNTSCGEIVIDGVQTIDYPHYFTPNGDGIHDTWNVIGLEDQPFARLYIFDRYGKFLKQLSTTGNGWDGTFNGYMLPADDYWFKLEYLDQTKTRWKEFKSHFTLKR